jgi:hypothetical protein
MNSIQNYLMATAVSTIRKAAANIIQDGEIDPVMVVASMQELITHIKNSESSLKSIVECNLKYRGVETARTPKEGDSGANPVFFQHS